MEEQLNTSILLEIKKLLGIDPDYKVFDTDVIVAINSEFMTLNQLGVGPNEGFLITGEKETWKDYFINQWEWSPFDLVKGVIYERTSNLEAVKSCLHLNARLLFDPPTSSFVLEAMKEMKREYEWRLNAQVEEGAIHHE